MPVRDVSELIRGQSVVTVAPETPVRDAAQVMARRGVGAAGVVAGERLVGVFSERDIMTRVVAASRDPTTTTIGEVMTPDPKTVRPECPVVEALELMIAGHFRHVPVVDGERILGMLSMRDVPLEYCVLRERWHAARRELETRRAGAKSWRSASADENWGPESGRACVAFPATEPEQPPR
jgi:CBS domain-containing protein